MTRSPTKVSSAAHPATSAAEEAGAVPSRRRYLGQVSTQPRTQRIDPRSQCSRGRSSSFWQRPVPRQRPPASPDASCELAYCAGTRQGEQVSGVSDVVVKSLASSGLRNSGHTDETLSRGDHFDQAPSCALSTGCRCPSPGMSRSGLCNPVSARRSRAPSSELSARSARATSMHGEGHRHPGPTA